MENYPEAIKSFRKAIELAPDSAGLHANLGYVYAKAGRIEEAKKVLEKLESISKDRYVSPYFMSLLYYGLGETETAIDFLEMGIEVRDEFMIFLNLDTVDIFSTIRSEPRYQNLLKKIGLEQK
jgi:tetratricopeptide (TPR) repeat protein